LILALIVFATVSVFDFYEFAVREKGMKLFGGIVFGIMSIFQAEELYTFIKNKQSNKLNHVVKSTSE